MKLVALSDTHSRVPENVPDGDVLIHAGDATVYGTRLEVMDFSAWFNDLPHEHKIFVPGNHDFLFEAEPYHARRLMTPTKVLMHEGWSFDGLSFFGSPYTAHLSGWAFYRRDEELAELFRCIPPCDVLVTHDAPFGTLDRVLTGEMVGAESLREAVLERVRPRVHVFGHIHEAHGSRVQSPPLTSYYNVSLQDAVSDDLVHNPTVIEVENT